MPKRVEIDITFETVECSVEECFPDGAPDEWDADTVLAAIQKDGPEAWMLLDGPSIHVHVIDPDGADSFAGEFAG